MMSRACRARRRESSRSSPRISSDSRESLPPPSTRLRTKLPPEGRARTTTPGSPDSCRRRSWAIWSLLLRALGLLHQADVDAAAVRGAASRSEAAAPGVGDHRVALRDGLPDHVLDPDQALPASARCAMPTASSTSTVTSPSSVCGSSSYFSIGMIRIGEHEQARAAKRAPSAGGSGRRGAAGGSPRRAGRGRARWR